MRSVSRLCSLLTKRLVSGYSLSTALYLKIGFLDPHWLNLNSRWYRRRYFWNIRFRTKIIRTLWLNLRIHFILFANCSNHSSPVLKWDFLTFFHTVGFFEADNSPKFRKIIFKVKPFAWQVLDHSMASWNRNVIDSNFSFMTSSNIISHGFFWIFMRKQVNGPWCIFIKRLTL